MFDDHEMSPADRLEEIERSKKALPLKFSFGDGVEHRVPIARCLYCGQPMFEIKRKANGDSIASCNTPDCLGNQNTKVSDIWLTAKRKMDDKLGIRDGVWVK